MRFDQTSLKRHQEQVTTEAGDLWVRELDAGDTSRIIEYATRPEFDPRGGLDRGEAALWQIALCCYHGPEDTAERVWPDEQVYRIRELPRRVFVPLVQAVNRINGESPEEVELVRDFTEATGAPLTSE